MDASNTVVLGCSRTSIAGIEGYAWYKSPGHLTGRSNAVLPLRVSPMEVHGWRERRRGHTLSRKTRP
jgi:hypothetical protein